jgi:excisionase family DNA binding protein
LTGDVRELDHTEEEVLVMSTTILREPQRAALEQSLALLTDVADARAQEAAERIRTALREADEEEYLTTTEAAHALGIRSVNTIKLWIKTGYLRGKKIGGRTLIPRTEIARLEHDEHVRAMQMVGRLHEESRDLGRDEGLTPDELRDLDEGRPGTLPWKR